MAITFEISITCDKDGCDRTETSEVQETEKMGNLLDGCEENGWYINGRYGNNYCPAHNHLGGDY